MLTSQLCTCCVAPSELHYLNAENRVVCLGSGHVYEKNTLGDFSDTGIDSADYQRRQNYLQLEFPEEARPMLMPRERIELSKYGYS